MDSNILFTPLIPLIPSHIVALLALVVVISII